MRILLLVEDVFAKTGGGETFARKLIADNPSLSFVYFCRAERATASRPANAEAVAVSDTLQALVHAPTLMPNSRREALTRAVRYASAVRGRQFDIIDCPDFLLLGPYLRAALTACRVGFGAIVQAMHGCISQSIRLDWDQPRDGAFDLAAMENEQFRDADHRYAISASYANTRRMETNAPDATIDLIDPFSAIATPAPQALIETSAKPALLCVGRRERRKGNDIALEIAAWIDPDLHGGLSHIGPPSAGGAGRSSEDYLTATAATRGIPYHAEAAMSQADLFARYAYPCIVLAPVRFDSFNLVALEAVCAGAPVAISQAAGAASFLAALPEKPAVVTFDHNAPDHAAAAVTSWLRDFQPIRTQALKAARALAARRPPLNMSAVYARALANGCTEKPAPQAESVAFTIVEAGRAPSRVSARLPAAALKRIARRWGLTERLRHPVALARHAVLGLQSVRRAYAATPFAALAARVNTMPEGRPHEIAAKIAALKEPGGHAQGRAKVWAELARLHRLCRQDLAALAYDLRVARVLGKEAYSGDCQHRGHMIAAGLTALDLTDAAAAFSIGETDLKQRLAARAHALKDAPPPRPLEALRDHRSGAPVRVSIIVSLYQANEKLTRFLDLISRQTLWREGGVELIFIDAHSPQPQEAFLAENAKPLRDATVVARTTSRITIQAAWNEGLRHARGAYVCFLGADETLYPTALSRLSAHLDAHPDCDWVMASSLVCAANATGGYDADKMLFDRRDAHQDMTYLDTTYVSWVGGLYRRTVHERFGYYDPRFRAAGDTEFKMRVLHHLRVDFVPLTLGQFLDYPDDRASASIQAEVEDSLAWYAHRTPAGFGLIADQLPTVRLENLLRWCAGRRKCYSQQDRTDVEMGIILAGLLHARPDCRLDAAAVLGFFENIRSHLRAHDAGDQRAGFSWRNANSVGAALLGAAGAIAPYTDNRFDQHSWFWPAN
jgi:glycosyltransferase involved in cell wall biosynthesis